MRKSKLLWLSGIIPTVITTPLVAVSCFWDPIPKPKPNKPSQPKPGPNPTPNPGTENGELPEAKEFSYDGQTYKIAKEDNIDKNALYYADEVLKNNAEAFKKMLPKAKEYEINNLNEYQFPTIAKLSQFIRSLDPYNRNYIFNNEREKRSISSQEYNQLISKIIKILEEYDYDNLFNQKKENIIKELWGRHYADWRDFCSNNKKSFGHENSNGTYEEKSAKDKGYNFKHHKNKLYRTPTILWKLNRDIDAERGFTNEMFLSRQFYEKTLNPDEELIDNDVLDYMYSNTIKAFAMQKPLFNMLIAYLRLLKAMSNGIHMDYTLTGSEREKMIKENGSIVDKTKTLEENMESSGIYDLISKFEMATIEYLKLSYLLGFTAAEGNNPSLQMFPGGTNYKYPIDFREAYAWAYYQYHRIIQPLRMNLDKRIDVLNTFNAAFNKASEKHYYDMIWANIKKVQNLDKPHLISQSEAKAKFELLIQEFSKKFNWRYKK